MSAAAGTAAMFDERIDPGRITSFLLAAVVAYNRYSHDIDRLAIRFESFMEEFSNVLQRQTVVRS